MYTYWEEQFYSQLNALLPLVPVSVKTLGYGILAIDASQGAKKGTREILLKYSKEIQFDFISTFLNFPIIINWNDSHRPCIVEEEEFYIETVNHGYIPPENLIEFFTKFDNEIHLIDYYGENVFLVELVDSIINFRVNFNPYEVAIELRNGWKTKFSKVIDPESLYEHLTNHNDSYSRVTEESISHVLKEFLLGNQ